MNMNELPKGLILRIGVAQSPDTGDELPVSSEPPKYEKLSYEDIINYYGALRPEIQKTSCKLSRLSPELEMELYFKNELEHFTGSMKERAARGVLLSLSPAERARGVVTATWGNFGLGLSHQGKLLGVKVRLFMPSGAAACKVSGSEAFGAEVELRDTSFDECLKLAKKDAEHRGAVFLPGCDSIAAMASLGTIGMEILEDVPDVDAVLVQVGSGSLLAGVSLAIKHVRPKAQIITVESETSASFYESMRKGIPVSTPERSTLATGLAVKRVAHNSFHNARRYVSKTVMVTEDMIADAMRQLVRREKLVVEGAGAASMAAILHCGIHELKNKKVVVILTGGNVDSWELCYVLGCGKDDRTVPEATGKAQVVREKDADVVTIAESDSVTDVSAAPASRSSSPSSMFSKKRDTPSSEEDDSSPTGTLLCKTRYYSSTKKASLT